MDGSQVRKKIKTCILESPKEKNHFLTRAPVQEQESNLGAREHYSLIGSAHQMKEDKILERFHLRREKKRKICFRKRENEGEENTCYIYL